MAYRSNASRLGPALLFCVVALLAHTNAFSTLRPCLLPTTHRCKASPSSLHAIVDEVTAEMKTAMKAKDKVTLNTVRLIRAAFANAAIDLKTDALTDEQAQGALRKLAKMRAESIDMYLKNGAEDRAEAERAELAVIERWLPSLADEDQTRIWVKDAIVEAGPDNMGKVMGALMRAHKAELDGKLAQRIVKEELKG